MADLKLKFKMPDDETLAEYISIKGEKGERGDPTKTSQLENDSDFTTNAALNAGLATKANATTVQSLSSQVDANTTALSNISARSIGLSTDATSVTKWFKLTSFPVEGNNSGNDASFMVRGKIGNSGKNGQAFVDIIIRNRNGIEVLGDYFVGDVENTHTDIAIYRDEDQKAIVYLKCQNGWSVVQLELDPRSQSSIEFDGTYTSSEPSGTLAWSLLNNRGYVQKNKAGTISADIDGDAATVNGHTVDADVPYDAAFTDTVYDDTAIRDELDLKPDAADVASTYATKAALDSNVSALQAQIESMSSGTPLPASSMSDMTDTTRIYVLATDGHWYYNNNGTWTDGGVYQATDLADDSVTHSKIASNIAPAIDGTNLIDWRELVDGYMGNDGTFHPNATSGSGLKYCTPFIPIDSSITTVYLRGCKGAIQCFDASKTRIGRATDSWSTNYIQCTLTSGTAYIRINVGAVIGTDDTYDKTLSYCGTINNTSQFMYSIDDLYERSASRVVYRTANGSGTGVGGGIYHDPVSQKIIIQNCTYCAIYANRTEYQLLSNQSTPRDFVLYDYSGVDNVIRVWFDTKTRTLSHTNSANSSKAVSNSKIFIAQIYGYNCHVAGIGELNQFIGVHPYFRPNSSSDLITTSKSGSAITVNFPAGSWYLLKDNLAYDRKAADYPTHESASYTLEGSSALVLNINDWSLSVVPYAGRNTFATSPKNIVLLFNIDGKLVYGELLPQLNQQMIMSTEAPKFGDEDINGMFDFHMSANLPYYTNDITFVGDELWAFDGTDDAHTNYGYIRRYKLDFEDKTLTYLGSGIQHNFGHCNTIDYCPENDTLILGNGGTAANPEPDQIYIIEHVSTLKNQSQWNLTDVAKIIDLDDAGLDWGRQINVCWGNGNRGNYNTAYVISNDGTNKFVHEIILGKGANQLTYGTAVSATEDEFNGTMNVINSYTGSYAVADSPVNQGSQFYKGKLWEAVGHTGAWIHISKLLTGGSIRWESYREKTLDESGNVVASFAEGCCIKDDYLITINCISNVSNTLLVYKI